MAVRVLGCVVLMTLCVSSQTMYPLRDPFHHDQKIKKSKTASPKPRLVGVVSCNDIFGALVVIDKKQCMVFKGDRIKGYTIQDIFPESITMKRGGIFKKLTIDEVNR